jgi:DNA-binding beta-propeller fold protein YncE
MGSLDASETIPWRSPLQARFSPDGKWLVVSDRTAGKLLAVDPLGGRVVKETLGLNQPTGVVCGPDAELVFVSEYATGTVAELDALKGQLIRHIPVGHGPMGLAVAIRRQLLIVCNSNGNDVPLVDIESAKEKAHIPVVRQPSFVAVTPDETIAVVSNLLPLGDATDPQTAACVSLIDLAGLKKAADIRFPPGSTNCRQIVISADGRWAYVVHSIGRTQQPATELEGGWINVHAMSILDLQSKTLSATVYLDRLTEGAANPWGIVLSPDEKTIWISLSGTHQLMRIDREGLYDFLDGKPIQGNLATTRFSQAAVGDKDKNQHPRERVMAAMDLASLYLTGLIKRYPLPGNGPRGLAMSPDGKTLAVCMYFSSEVLLVDAATGGVSRRIPLGPQRKMDKIRRGEMIFHDAAHCLQHWLSCASCHPDGRVDGLNWDLTNDGAGNPKNTRSLVCAHKTKPMMALGVRPDFESAVDSGFRNIQFYEPTKEEVEATVEYLRSLRPERSPHRLADGELSPSGKRGQEIFRSKAGCSVCHSEPSFTDQQMHDVGTTQGKDKGKKVKTSTLIECWCTAPYLNNGAAVDLREVLTKFNQNDRHGKTSSLTQQELDDLVEYLLSL